MGLQRSICRAVFLSLIAVTAMPACAALHMSVTADTRNQPNQDAKTPPGGTQQSEVVLADSVISSRAGNKTFVFDFAQRRRYVLDETARTYDEYSLFDVVGFRELELRNRDGLRAGLAAAKLDQKLASRLEDEHELAIQGAAPTPLTTRIDGDDEVFMSGDVELLRHSKAGTPVSAPDAARFVQYLRYLVPAHPAVLAALQKEQRVPARLVLSFHPIWGGSTIELKIGALRQDDAQAAPALAGYAARPPAATATTLDELLDRAWASRATLAAGMKQPPAEALAAQLSGQRPLEAWLTISELQLSSGRMPAITDEQKLAFRTDPDIQAMARAVSAKDPNGIRQAVGTFGMLRLKAQSRRYMLSLFEANDRVLLGEPDKARSLYADVLQANPALAGAYKDIGDFYFRSFDTPRAWRSWDIARTLGPLFPSVGAVTQFERSLATRFPEYF
jgi:hypothetical protein